MKSVTRLKSNISRDKCPQAEVLICGPKTTKENICSIANAACCMLLCGIGKTKWCRLKGWRALSTRSTGWVYCKYNLYLTLSAILSQGIWKPEHQGAGVSLITGNSACQEFRAGPALCTNINIKDVERDFNGIFSFLGEQNDSTSVYIRKRRCNPSDALFHWWL